MKADKMVISTEHILLGLCHGEPCVASNVLAHLGVRPEAIEAEITKLEPDPVSKKPRTKVILSRDAKRAIDATFEEVKNIEGHTMGTEHLLLGLIKQGGAASKILATLGIDIEKARHAVAVIPKIGEGGEPVE
jgi:ATP-dependent Clp protease ATP-binding subunit ClpC